MRKLEELISTASCLNKAADDELLFVLLARDAAAPPTIRFWCSERIRLGKNVASDQQIQEALSCASNMERDHAKLAELGKR